MTFLKRAIATLSIFSVLVVGSLSFFPSSFAVDDYQFPFYDSDIPSVNANYVVQFSFHYFYNSVDYYYFYVLGSASPIEIRKNPSSTSAYFYSASSMSGYFYNSNNGEWRTTTRSNGYFSAFDYRQAGSPFPYYSSSSDNRFQSIETSYSYSLLSDSSISDIPKYWDYMPFYFPQLPYGIFDGNFVAGMNGTNTLSLNFDNLTGTSTGSFTYSESGSGSGTYSGSSTSSGGTISGGTYTGSGSLTIPSGTYLGDYSGDNFNTGGSANDTSEGQIYMPNGSSASLPVSSSGSFTGTVSGGSGSESGTLSISSLSESGSGSLSVGDTYSGSVSGNFSYNPSYSDHARFRTWAVVSGTAYVYFISDVRNRITATLDSVSDSGAKVRYLCKGDDNVYYPCYYVTFNYFGEKVASASQLANGITVDFSPGTLSQDEDTGKWSVDPLYHGVWFSDQSPSVNLSPLTNTEDLKWLANPVFGEEAFVLNFLDSINSNLVTINENLVSLTNAMQQSISNQTSSILGATASPATQPDTSDMMDYFSESSVFNAPDSSGFFDGNIADTNFYAGTRWWTSKFNDIFQSENNSAKVLVAFTTAMLTIGLGAFIIGRKVFIH